MVAIDLLHMAVLLWLPAPPSITCQRGRSTAAPFHYRSRQSLAQWLLPTESCGLWNGLRRLLLAPTFWVDHPFPKARVAAVAALALPLSPLEGHDRGAIVE